MSLTLSLSLCYSTLQLTQSALCAASLTSIGFHLITQTVTANSSTLLSLLIFSHCSDTVTQCLAGGFLSGLCLRCIIVSLIIGDNGGEMEHGPARKCEVPYTVLFVLFAQVVTLLYHSSCRMIEQVTNLPVLRLPGL